MAQLLLTMEDADGGIFSANPREVLKRVVQRFKERGLTPVVAVELEFYLLDAELTPDGRPQTSVNPATGERNVSTQVYYMQDLNDYQEFTDAVADACRAQGIPADTGSPNMPLVSSRLISSIVMTPSSPATTRST